MRRGVQVPKYRKHLRSGQAVVTVPGGGGRVVYLGPYNSPESRTRYAEVLAAWAAGKATPRPAVAFSPGSRSYTIGRLALEYSRHLETYFGAAFGKPSKQAAKERSALIRLVKLFETVEVEEFGPKRLIEYQAALAAEGLSRTTVSHSVGIVRRAVKWAVCQEKVGGGVLHALAAVPPLKPGRSPAKEPKKIRPVSPEHVERTLPFLSPVLRDAVKIQALLGCRADELLSMRWCEIDRTGPIWRYAVSNHKNLWRGQTLIKRIGPKAQEILARYEGKGPEEFIFSPRDSIQEHRQRQRADRKTPLWASHKARYAKQRKPKPKRAPGERFTSESYGRAIRRAAKNASVPPWHSHQLRHGAATEIRKRFGVEGAQVTLGHARIDVTQRYAQQSEQLADRIAAEVG